MLEEWRSILYPLGFIASLTFSIRFIIQWILSEKRKESYVPASFWKVSIFGNILMTAHTFIQVQYPFCIIQACNAVISWRNLNLMKEPSKRASLRSTLLILFLTLAAITLAFALEGIYLYGKIDWIRTPTLPWEQNPAEPLSLAWHIMGFVGSIIFSSRFWVQWWTCEKNKVSRLGTSFWWISLIGATLALIYFIRLGDVVYILGYSVGIIPYVRNIILLNRSRKKMQHATDALV